MEHEFPKRWRCFNDVCLGEVVLLHESGTERDAQCTKCSRVYLVMPGAWVEFGEKARRETVARMKKTATQPVGATIRRAPRRWPGEALRAG